MLERESQLALLEELSAHDVSLRHEKLPEQLFIMTQRFGFELAAQVIMPKQQATAIQDECTRTLCP